MDPMARSRIVFSKDDLQDLPEDWRAEIIEGDLILLPSPHVWHQGLVTRVYHLLIKHLGEEELDRVLVAPLDVVLDDHNVLQPDILVLPEGTKLEPPPWTMPRPIWVCDVLSPSTERRDRGIRLRVYARFGVREAWLVDLATGERKVRQGGEAATSTVLPGFSVASEALFSAR